MSASDEELQGITSMARALRWAERRDPPARFVKAVGQDEFTFDVIVQLSSRSFAVFDTS